MTSTFLLKGHDNNYNTVIVIIEGKIVNEGQMPQEEFLGAELANTLYNTLPGGTIDAMVAEFKQLRKWDES